MKTLYILSMSAYFLSSSLLAQIITPVGVPELKGYQYIDHQDLKEDILGALRVELKSKKWVNRECVPRTHSAWGDVYRYALAPKFHSIEQIDMFISSKNQNVVLRTYAHEIRKKNGYHPYFISYSFKLDTDLRRIQSIQIEVFSLVHKYSAPSNGLPPEINREAPTFKLLESKTCQLD